MGSEVPRDGDAVDLESASQRFVMDRPLDRPRGAEHDCGQRRGAVLGRDDGRLPPRSGDGVASSSPSEASHVRHERTVMGRGDWHLHWMPRVARPVALSLPASRSPRAQCTAHGKRVRRPCGIRPPSSSPAPSAGQPAPVRAGAAIRVSFDFAQRAPSLIEEEIEPTRRVNPTGKQRPRLPRLGVLPHHEGGRWPLRRRGGYPGELAPRAPSSWRVDHSDVNPPPCRRWVQLRANVGGHPCRCGRATWKLRAKRTCGDPFPVAWIPIRRLYQELARICRCRHPNRNYQIARHDVDFGRKRDRRLQRQRGSALPWHFRQNYLCGCRLRSPEQHHRQEKREA